MNHRELQWSQKFHSRYPAVLVSSQVLRRRHLGQVDVCFLQEKLVIVEVKGYFSPGAVQRQRLRAACQWLGGLLQREVIFMIAHDKREL